MILILSLSLFSIHNFHPQYSQYEQHFSTNQSQNNKQTSLDMSSDSIGDSSNNGRQTTTTDTTKQPFNSNRPSNQLINKNSETESTMRNRPANRNKTSEVNLKNAATILSIENEKRIQNLNQNKSSYTEKTTLLSSDDEFQ